MRAAVIHGFGPPEALRPERVAVPEPTAGEVLVRVLAAGVNAIDWATRAGRGVSVTGFPAVLGWDVCGTVVAAGPGVTRWRVGDLVFGMPRFPGLAGAYAEFVAAPADQLAPVPEGVSTHAAAAAPMVALTAWQSLFTIGGLAAGQTVLVHGAAGGVGHVAVQLARWAGAQVIGTASAASHEFVLGLGADRVIEYAELGGLAADADLAVDPRGGADFVRLLDVLRPGGTIVTLKGAAPGQSELAAGKGRRAGFTYVQPDPAPLTVLGELIARGQLTVAIQEVLGLDEAAAAHRIGERGHVRGRIVLDAGDG